MAKKKALEVQDELKNVAVAVGSALGKLAAKMGLSETAVPAAPKPPAKKSAPKKKVTRRNSRCLIRWQACQPRIHFPSPLLYLMATVMPVVRYGYDEMTMGTAGPVTTSRGSWTLICITPLTSDGAAPAYVTTPGYSAVSPSNGVFDAFEAGH
jgi:hypothetical protein